MTVNLVWGNLTIPAANTLNGTATPAAARQLAVAGSRSAVPLVYGEDRIGAGILNVLPAAAGSTVLLVQCLWAFAGDSVNDLLLNDQALPAGSTQTHYDGSQSTPDSAMVTAMAAQGITYTDTLAGFMFSVVGIPLRSFDGRLNFTARIKGRKLYDPRLDSTLAGGSGSHRLATPSTWAWSANPSLATGDFCYSTLYGLNRTVNWLTVQTAANANDAMIGSPAEKSRTLGISFITPAAGADMAETLRGHAGCFFLQGASGIELLADANDASSATYAHASGQIAGIGDLVKRDLGNSPTAVEIIYTDTTQVPWRDGSVTAQVSGAGTTLPWRLSQVRMPGVNRYSQANREAIERLNKLTLNDLSCTLDIFDIGIAHQLGDIVTVTHPVGLAAKLMRATDVEMTGPGRWRLGLVEHDAAAYSTVVATVASTPDTGFVNPAGPPSTPGGFTHAYEAGGVRLMWDKNPEVDVVSYELRAGASWGAGTPLVGSDPTIVSATSFLWQPQSVGALDVMLKALDNEGLESTTEATDTVGLTETTLTGGGGNLLLCGSMRLPAVAGVAGGWAAGASLTPTVQATGAPFGNTECQRVTATALRSIGATMIATGNFYTDGGMRAPSLTQACSAIVSFYARSADSSYLDTMGVHAYAAPTQTEILNPVTGPDWQRYAFQWEVNVGGLTDYGSFWIMNGGVMSSGAQLDIADVQVEYGHTLTNYAETLYGPAGTAQLSPDAASALHALYDDSTVVSLNTSTYVDVSNLSYTPTDYHDLEVTGGGIITVSSGGSGAGGVQVLMSTYDTQGATHVGILLWEGKSTTTALDATFPWTAPEHSFVPGSLASQGSSIQLKCVLTGSHSGVTASSTHNSITVKERKR